MVILVDSREQKPYTFQGACEVGTVPVGDYSIAGLDCIAIERKELNDLIGSLTTGRERFERELFKGKSLEYFALVCECSLSDIIEHKYRSDMNPKSVIQSLVAFSIRYHLPIWFAGSRAYGERLTESLLLKYGREIEKKFKTLNDHE